MSIFQRFEALGLLWPIRVTMSCVYEAGNVSKCWISKEYKSRMETIATKELTTFQLRAARKALGITFQEISERTGVAVSSLARMEAGNVFLFPEHSSVPTVYAVRNFLESHGIRFLQNNGLQLVNPDEKIQIRIVPTN